MYGHLQIYLFCHELGNYGVSSPSLTESTHRMSYSLGHDDEFIYTTYSHRFIITDNLYARSPHQARSSYDVGTLFEIHKDYNEFSDSIRSGFRLECRTA